MAQFMQFEADQAEEEKRRVEAAKVAEETLCCKERPETEQLHRRSGIVDLLYDCRRQMQVVSNNEINYSLVSLVYRCDVHDLNHLAVWKVV